MWRRALLMMVISIMVAQCRRSDDFAASIAADPLVLMLPAAASARPAPVSPPEPRIFRIEAKGTRTPSWPETAATPAATPEKTPLSRPEPAPAALPPGSFRDDVLTRRLQEKLSAASALGESQTEIYTSQQTLDEFTQYYKSRGFAVTQLSIPVNQILQPVVRDKPELAAKINLDAYKEMRINQVMVEKAGISAADKYIDPDTYEIVNKLFITVLK